MTQVYARCYEGVRRASVYKLSERKRRCESGSGMDLDMNEEEQMRCFPSGR